MQCRTCRTTIPNEATQCSRCGTPVATVITNFDTNSYEYESEAVPYIPYSPLLAAPGISPKSVTATMSPSHELPNVASSNKSQSVVQDNFGQNSPALTRTVLLLIVLLALLITGSVSGILVYANVVHPAELQANATAVAQSIVTGQAQATATANAQSPQSVYNRTTQTNPSFSDALDGRSSSPWSARSIGNSSCVFSNGAYHLHVAPTDDYVYCSATGTNYKNFIYQVQITMINDLAAGITFRSSNENLPSFVFSITTTGLYSLDTLQNPLQVLAFGRSSAIHLGQNQTNVIAVMARGSTISLFINKQFIKSVSDENYSPGEIGMFTGNAPRSNIDVAYSNAQVWSLP